MSTSLRDVLEGAALAVRCPTCNAKSGRSCKTRKGTAARRLHERRRNAGAARRLRAGHYN